MQAQSTSRKRAAPGSLPMRQQQSGQQPTFDFAQTSSGPTDQYANQITSNNSFPTYDSNLYANNLNGSQAQSLSSNLATAVPIPSNQLVRRNANQQLARNGVMAEDQYGPGNPMLQPEDYTYEEVKDEELDLDERAALAKRDAQAKRKQIPPFVLKLWR